MLLPLLSLSSVVIAVTGCHLSPGGGVPQQQPDSACEFGRIYAVFFMFDGSRTVVPNFHTVNPFVKLFKKYLSHSMHVWFLQWSSPMHYCGIKTWDGGKNASWDCYGKDDRCMKKPTGIYGQNCPLTEEEYLPVNWTDEKFDAASDRIYSKIQKGWTHPWRYILGAAQKWDIMRTEKKLPVGARALVVFASDGEVGDKELAQEATREFKKANLRFIAINEHTTRNFGFEQYYPLMDDPKKPDVFETTKFNEDLVKKILNGTCNW